MDVTKELLQELSDEFDQFCQERHDEGAQEYGELNFLRVDLPQFIYEELADIVNYSRFLYIRLRIIEEAARERGLDISASLAKEEGQDNEVPFGPSSFVSSEKISGFLPDSLSE